jgi:hypothetical protein
MYISSQKTLILRLEEISNKVSVFQLVSHKKDLLSFLENAVSIEGDDTIVFHEDMKKYLSSLNSEQYIFKSSVPPPLHEYPIDT